MKIEKLNENQVKFILSREDLQHWDIKLTELTQGTERTYEFFHDMMEQASTQCDFHVGNSPLLIEALPHSADGMVIIVTKVTNSGEIDERFTFPPVSKLLERFRSKAVTEIRLNVPERTEPVSVFAFVCLDDAINASSRLKESYWGHSALYKNESRYFLMLNHDQNSANLTQDDIEAVLSEYGQKTAYSQYYLSEHGEMLIRHSAVNVLSRM